MSYYDDDYLISFIDYFLVIKLGSIFDLVNVLISLDCFDYEENY